MIHVGSRVVHPAFTVALGNKKKKRTEKILFSWECESFSNDWLKDSKAYFPFVCFYFSFESLIKRFERYVCYFAFELLSEKRSYSFRCLKCGLFYSMLFCSSFLLLLKEKDLSASCNRTKGRSFEAWKTFAWILKSLKITKSPRPLGGEKDLYKLLIK